MLPKLEPLDEDYGRGPKRQRIMSPPQPQQQQHYLQPGGAGYGARTDSPLPPGTDLASLTSLLNPSILRTASASANFRPSATPPPSSSTPSQWGSYPSAGTTQASTPFPAPAGVGNANGLSNPSLASALANLDPKLLASFTSAAQATSDAAARLEARKADAHALAAYEHHREHFSVELRNADIARYRPGAAALIHDAMPLRCKQCSNRYLDSPAGKERLARDLDRHLRISRRYTEGIGAQRAVGRNWFATEEVSFSLPLP